MARRVRDAGLSFGSDSFLDIIANIVGILIILIVVAGVRVSQAPVMLQAAHSPETPLLPLPTIVEPDRNDPAPELVEQYQRLQAAVSVVEDEANDRQRRLEQLAAETDALRRVAPKSAAELQQAQRRRAAAERAAHDLRQDIERTEAELAAKFVEIDAAERNKPASKQIQHKLTHVSRIVGGGELHFLLSAEAVAFVPTSEFEQRMQVQVQQARHWLIKGQPSRGTIGPIGGFTMEYAMALQPLSALEQLQRGSGFARLQVRGVFRPEPDLDVETADQALAAGSRFFLALKSAERDTTLTFWVHPDSFALYRRLQEFAHKEGFLVAARPLPEGMPITFSTNGSKSAGQ